MLSTGNSPSAALTASPCAHTPRQQTSPRHVPGWAVFMTVLRADTLSGTQVPLRSTTTTRLPHLTALCLPNVPGPPANTACPLPDLVHQPPHPFPPPGLPASLIPIHQAWVSSGLSSVSPHSHFQLSKHPAPAALNLPTHHPALPMSSQNTNQDRHRSQQSPLPIAQQTTGSTPGSSSQPQLPGKEPSEATSSDTGHWVPVTHMGGLSYISHSQL